MAYGVEPETFDHPFITLSERTMHIADLAAAPGAFLVDIFPLCKFTVSWRICLISKICLVRHIPSWMPGAGFQRQAKKWSVDVTACLEEPFAFVEEQLVCIIHITTLQRSFLIHITETGQGKQVSYSVCS